MAAELHTAERPKPPEWMQSKVDKAKHTGNVVIGREPGKGEVDFVYIPPSRMPENLINEIEKIEKQHGTGKDLPIDRLPVPASRGGNDKSHPDLTALVQDIMTERPHELITLRKPGSLSGAMSAHEIEPAMEALRKGGSFADIFASKEGGVLALFKPGFKPGVNTQ